MVDKKTFKELEEDLISAAKQVKLGGLYSHYRHPEIVYVVNGLLVIEENNEIAVRYSQMLNPKVEFVRPLNIWLQKVEWDSKKISRFTLIDDPAKPALR